MREYKFRAWLKETKEMIQAYDISWDKEMINTDGAWRYFDEIELMQYTELKDKNGVEVCEGDIVHCKGHFSGYGWFDTGEHDYDFIGVVTYGGGGYRINSKHIDEYYFEVIGNIHDNPELLEVK